MPEAAAPGRRLSAQAVAAQIDAVLAAWGLPDAPRADAVEIMTETDLRGIDSHGVAMLPVYDEMRRDGRINMRPEVRVLSDAKAVQLVDADAGLGYHPGKRAVAAAVERAGACGLGAVAVRNSNHFGAAGAYALRAAQAGCIGLVATNAVNPAIVPTRARQKLFGTNPLAFAAPAGRHPPFVLDMATSTVAVGKLKLKWLAGAPLPAGWAVDAAGRPETDSERAYGRLQRIAPEVGLTPLGGLAETASHKGYGLAAMVEILSATLTGAAFIGTRLAEGRTQNDIGHFFLAIDPAAFRPAGAFEADLDAMIEAMHALAPADPAQPVLVPGEPEAASLAERTRDGVPVPDRLWRQIRDLCAGCGAPFLWNA